MSTVATGKQPWEWRQGQGVAQNVMQLLLGGSHTVAPNTSLPPGQQDPNVAYQRGHANDLKAGVWGGAPKTFGGGMQAEQMARRQNMLGQQGERAASAETRAQEAHTQQQDVYKQQQMDMDQSYMDHIRWASSQAKEQEIEGRNPYTVSRGTWRTMEAEDRENRLPAGRKLDDYTSRPSANMQEANQLNEYWDAQNPDATPEERTKAHEANLLTSMANEAPGSVEYRKVDDNVYKIVTSAGGKETPTLMKPGSDEYETGVQRIADEEKSKSGAAAAQKIDNQFRDNAADRVPKLRQAYESGQKLLQQLESGKFAGTGYLEGEMKKFNDEDTAYLHAKSIERVLENLQLTNLAPVTEREIALLQGMFPSIDRETNANIGALKAAQEVIMKRLRLLSDQRDYWNENDGTLEGYNLMKGDAPWTEFAPGEGVVVPEPTTTDPVVEKLLGGKPE